MKFVLRSIFVAVLAVTFGPAQQPAPLADPNEPLKRFGDLKSREKRGPFPGGKFTLEAGGTVAFVGQENFVRLARAGLLEALIWREFVKTAPRFRWMAVEGDTVYEQAREMNFGSWTGQMEWAGASVILCQFGQVEALDGPGRIPEFVAAYHRLIDQFIPVTSRIVLLSPVPYEKPTAPFAPDLSRRNGDLAAYAAAIREIARSRGALFVDCSVKPPAASPESRLEDGMHFNDSAARSFAYQLAGSLLEKSNLAAVEPELLAVIGEKNRLWTDCWRPANWAFAYGDRTWAEFGKPGGGAPFLKEEFAQLRPRIVALESKAQAMLEHQPVPQTPEPPPLRKDDFPALTPDQEMASFKVADGYEISLAASEADGVVKPIQISWDESGRLLVACSPSYPHLMPGEAPSDYVLMCEDADHDGHFEKTWKYASGLTMTQGVEPGNGGIYICDFTELIHCQDTNGDGKADTRRVVFSGFGTGDTHQLINSICHGDDGSLWFTQGLHINSRIETPWGLTVLEKSGVWRMDPKSLRLDPFFNGAKAGHNCWGVAFDDFGQVFHKSGDRPEGYYSVPGMVRLQVPDEYHPTGSLFQTNPKTTALDIVGAKALPDDVQGCAVIAGFMGGVVELHQFIDAGSGYRTEQRPKLLTSTSDAFRPVDVSVGPDGAIYVCDFYNPIIGHYQNSYRDPKRDKTHGRIWRIAAKNRPKTTAPILVGKSPAELLEHLASPERWVRFQAKRLLADSSREAVLAAADVFAGKLDAETPDGGRIMREVLGVFLAHHAPRPLLLDKLTAATDARLRAYATRAVGQWAEELPDATARLKERVRDENPRVRLEAVVAASYLPSQEAPEIALTALDRPRDRFLDYALAQSLRATREKWLPAFVAGKFAAAERPAARELLEKLHGAAALPSPGRVLYETTCLNCHQPDGRGLAGIYPPLAGSDWITGDPARAAKVLLNGLTDQITVNGAIFQSPAFMPASGLTDEQIADVLTYLRSSFGNSAPAVSAATVRAAREAAKGRTEPWKEADLK